MAGEQAPPPLRFAQVTMSLGRVLHSLTGRAASRPPGRSLPQGSNCFSGGKLPYEVIAANPAYTPPGSIKAREGLRALSRSPGEERRAAAKPCSSKAATHPAPAAQRPAPAASQTTAPIRRKPPNRPRACRAAASSSRLPNNGADTPQSTNRPRACRAAASPSPPPPHSGAAAF